MPRVVARFLTGAQAGGQAAATTSTPTPDRPSAEATSGTEAASSAPPATASAPASASLTQAPTETPPEAPTPPATERPTERPPTEPPSAEPPFQGTSRLGFNDVWLKRSGLFADLTVWLAIVLPGVAFALGIGVWWFGLDLDVIPLVVPALLLVVLTAASVGYAMASVLPPAIAQLLTQVMVVFVLMFSPLNFPPERLPDWLQAVHAVLPIQAMGEIIRGTVAAGTFPMTASAWAVLGAWCIGGLGIAWATLQRRG